MIPVVDLFAGPGGLAEGFSACRKNGKAAFEVSASAEMDATAHQTLRLRAFFRELERNGGVPDSYYEYVSGQRQEPFDFSTKRAWERACGEALNLTLGVRHDNAALSKAIRTRVNVRKPWVLIGGPPCQAYSLVGRSRNAGIQGYKPELDERMELYREYLHILREFKPAVFVMENVKGLLSSRLAGKRVFQAILQDLSKPSRDCEYAIYSLTSPTNYRHGDDIDDLDPYSYVVQCEDYGIPQRRHRVILVGIRKDLDSGKIPLLRKTDPPSLRDAVSDLPRLRSGLSQGDSASAWTATVRNQAALVVSALRGRADAQLLASALKRAVSGDFPYLDRGGQCVSNGNYRVRSKYARFLADERLPGILNHSTRGHMDSDLGRYLFLAAFGTHYKKTPSTPDFPKELAADHENWDTGDFADRFRVQILRDQATTVMSHISKDGHYYVLPDVLQCRSFTVREAARIQSFPDNYFFEGCRTEQFVQVGNAVPPLVAKQIASSVSDVLL